MKVDRKFTIVNNEGNVRDVRGFDLYIVNNENLRNRLLPHEGGSGASKLI